MDAERLNRVAFGSYVTESASGSITSFFNGADSIPMKDVLVHIEPVQAGSGDPSPDNVRPITGWTGAKVTRCGKNMLNSNDPDYGNYTIGPDGTYGSDTNRIATGFIPCTEGISLTFSTNKKTDGVGTDVQFAFAGIAAYDKDKNFLTRETVNNQRIVTITTPTGTKYVRAFEQVTIRGTSATITPADFATYEQQLELGSTATDYEPYSGQTYDITFPSEAGTVYGGTLDVTKGELVVDRVAVVLDGSNITVDGKADYGKYIMGVFNYKARMPAARYNGSNTYVLADKLTISYEYTVGVNASKTASGFWVYPHSSGLFITMMSADYPSIASINAWLAENTPTVCYELATPITYQLTPQEITSLRGENNVWADTGDSEVEYRVDPALLLDDELSEVQSMIAGVESSAVATKNYSIGDLVIVGDTLYEVTAAIASGETISASNTVVTTVDNTIRNRIADSIDDTLTQSGQAADAKAVGDEISLEKTGSFSLQSSDFENGTYNSHFDPVASTYRIRTAKKIPVYSGEKITIIPGEKCGRVAYGFFNESDVYLDAVAVTSETVITVSNQTYIIFICMYPNMGTTINPSDFDAVIEFTSFTQSEIESIQNNVESKQTDYGYNLIYKLSQFNQVRGVAVTVDSKKSLYAQDGIITLKSADFASNYRNAIMANNPLTFEAGAMYVMHATAKVITAPSKPAFSVRYGTTGFPPAHSTPAITVTEPGIYELETTFVADGNEKTAGLFITGSETTLYPEVEFSNVYIKRVISTGARDDLCRIAIRQLIGVIEQKINGAHTLADNVKTEILFNTAAEFTPQGACTDGENIYYAGYGPAVLGKYNIATGENTIVEADSQIIGHANDMTYNPNTGYLYIATMQNHAIAIYDTDFQYINTITLNTEYQPYQIAYIRNLNQYVVSLSSKFVFYDANFELLYDIEPSSVPNYIAQGMETDGEYLYRVYYSQSVIAVYTMYGELIKTIGATNITGEPETLCYDWNGNWYASSISSGFTLFRIAVNTINDGIEAIKSLLI